MRVQLAAALVIAAMREAWALQLGVKTKGDRMQSAFQWLQRGMFAVTTIGWMACSAPASEEAATRSGDAPTSGSSDTMGATVGGGAGASAGGGESGGGAGAGGGSTGSTGTPTAPGTPSTPAALQPIYGVTVDDVSNVTDIVESLKRLAHKPTTRVVFDEFVAASYYTAPVGQISNVSFVMGELLDSFYVPQYTTKAYVDRTSEYLAALGGKVDIWEVGNEINGEWLGDTATVTAKMTGAYDKVKAAGKKTALTLYYNEECWEKADHEMFTWTQANVPANMKSGLDYVFVSYYEDDCNGLQPDWNAIFAKLAQMFPSSQIGFGECGTTQTASKATYVNRYYKMQITAPRFVGGYFWWYFKQDMVPYTKTLWSTLNAAIQ